MIAFVFPGQGSQRRGMGQGLFDEVREYRSVEKDVDSVLGYSMRRLCLDDPGHCLANTRYTQPSLYVVNALHYYKALSQGVFPSYVVGHSLGEYNALLAAGAFDFMTGLRLVKKRGEIMSQAKNGRMAAVVGLSDKAIAGLIMEKGLSTIDVANFNSPSQLVLSGPAHAIADAGTIFEEAGAQMYIQLQVSSAFHSRYMASAAREFAEFLMPMSFSALELPVIANVTGKPYYGGNASETIKSLLVDQITRPVQWMQSIQFLLHRGISEFKEMGPGNVLTRLIQQIQKEA